MTEKEIEELIKFDIEQAYTTILKNCNYILPISAKSRSGAEISDYLEDMIVDYFSKNNHERVNHVQKNNGSTKSPYDFCFNYSHEDYNDWIWADIKASKRTFEDSNPDLGTPEKMVKFIMDGHFYLLFVFFEYESTEDNKTKFLMFEDEKYVHCCFLKDVHHSVRINPKPQFQVNIHEPQEYRTRLEFVDLFEKKYNESIDRIIQKQNKKKEKLSERFVLLKDKVKKYNNKH